MIDAEADLADHDAVAACIDALSERRLWILYRTLYARGFRIDRAQHEIHKLAPRKEAA